MPASNTQRNSVTLRDVAAAANVSVSAVSQAINKTGNLHADTRKHILSVAKDLGFTPNRYAASLRRKQTMAIGYVSSTDSDISSQKRWANYFGQQLAALVSAAAERGYTVTVIPHDKPELLAVSQVDAVYMPEVEGENLVVDEAQRRNIPIVASEIALEYEFSITVRGGYDRATTTALDALAERGAKRIGLLTEVPGLAGDDQGESTYLAWCAEHAREPIVARGDYGRTDLVERVAELVAAGVDAIFSFYEEGPAILEILRASAVRVPEDIQLIAMCLDDCVENERLGVSRVCAHPELAPESVISALVELVEHGRTEHRDVELPIDHAWSRTTR